MFTCIHSTKTYIPGRVVSSFLLRLRLIKASLAKFRWPLGEAPSALGTFFGRRGGINNLFDCVCGKLLSAQPPAGLAAGPHWRLDREAKLDQAADSCGASKARLFVLNPTVYLCQRTRRQRQVNRRRICRRPAAGSFFCTGN